MLYISQLIETPKLTNLLELYPIGLEVISFSIGIVLDDLERMIPYYEEEFKAFKERTPLTFHGPFLDLLPGSCDPKVQDLAKERFENAFKAAKAFGVNQFVFHTGYMPNTYPNKYWLENIVAFWKAFIKDKIDSNYIYIENVLDGDWQLLKALIDEIDHPHFKACLDIGHVQAYSNQNVEKWIESLGERIGYVHLHNNNGVEDEHRGLLHGIIPINQVLSQIKSKAPAAHWSLEISNEEELIESIKYILKEY